MTIKDEQHAKRLAELRRVFDNGAAIMCPTFQDAAKRVGIDNTHAAWAAWLEAEPPQLGRCGRPEATACDDSQRVLGAIPSR